MALPTSMSYSDPGGIFVDTSAYADLDSWHRQAALLRAEAPVHRVEIPGWLPFWAITRFEDVWQIERAHERFPNTLQSVLFRPEFYERQAASGLIIKSLVQMDDPEHKQYRLVTNEWFKPANLRRVAEARVQELARKFVDRMMELGPECDFAREIGLLYPLHVIMTILGVPEADEPRMLMLTQKLFASEDPEFGGGADSADTLMNTTREFFEYFNDLTVDRRKNPMEDIATVLANGTIDGEPLGDIERLGYYMIVATAGHDTTSNSLNAGIEALCQHPDQLRALQEDPSGIDRAVDEIIRWATPVRHFLRHATEDSEIAGQKIAKGEAVLLSYLSANRDETRFEDPMRFDITRANAGDHLAFGTGVHFCLGAHLARLELRAFLRELVSRVQSMEVAGPTDHVHSNFVGGLKNLPLRYELHPAA
jgi:cytochrome P450